MSSAVASATSKFRCFDDKLKAKHSRLSTKQWGWSMVEHRPPLRYTDELLGLEYLYSQTARSLSLATFDTDADVDNVDMDEIADEDDEGFIEEEDMTVSLVVSVESTAQSLEETAEQPTSPASSSPERAQSPPPEDVESEGEAVGPDGLPGFRAVQDLAEYLISLDSVTCLTNRHVDNSVSLWDRLSERDRQRVVYTRRYRTRILTERFRQKGSRSFVPGRDSVQRAFLSHGTPVQKPGLSCLVNAIFSRLYSKYRRDTVIRTPRGRLCVPKWKLILDKYADLGRCQTRNKVEQLCRSTLSRNKFA